MLTGKHPFYQSGDTEDSYTQRISKTNIDKSLQKSLEKYNMSREAKSLITRLLAKGISDRYRVG